MSAGTTTAPPTGASSAGAPLPPRISAALPPGTLPPPPRPQKTLSSISTTISQPNTKSPPLRPHQLRPEYTQPVDLLIVAGTALQVHPFNCIPNFVPPHCPRVLINRPISDAVGRDISWEPAVVGTSSTSRGTTTASSKRRGHDVLAAPEEPASREEEEKTARCRLQEAMFTEKRILTRRSILEDMGYLKGEKRVSESSSSLPKENSPSSSSASPASAAGSALLPNVFGNRGAAAPTISKGKGKGGALAKEFGAALALQQRTAAHAARHAALQRANELVEVKPDLIPVGYSNLHQHNLNYIQLWNRPERFRNICVQGDCCDFALAFFEGGKPVNSRRGASVSEILALASSSKEAGECGEDAGGETTKKGERRGGGGRGGGNRKRRKS